jgi:hypothetical protein
VSNADPSGDADGNAQWEGFVPGAASPRALRGMMFDAEQRVIAGVRRDRGRCLAWSDQHRVTEAQRWDVGPRFTRGENGTERELDGEPLAVVTRSTLRSAALTSSPSHSWSRA